MNYTESHEWIRVDGNIATMGITHYAQKELGDIVYVELPTVGATVGAGDEVVVLESTKAAVDIYTPISGEIVAVNEYLREQAHTVNEAAETDGWLCKIKIQNTHDLNSLMDEKEYKTYIKNPLHSQYISFML